MPDRTTGGAQVPAPRTPVATDGMTDDERRLHQLGYWAYLAVTSIAVIVLYIAYVTPTFLRLRAGDRFQPGPWHLGRWSRPIGTIAVVWVVFISVLFMLPTASPITGSNVNDTVVAVVVVLGVAGIWWLVSAKNWFPGPKVQGSDAELEAVEHDLETLGGSAG